VTFFIIASYKYSYLVTYQFIVDDYIYDSSTE